MFKHLFMPKLYQTPFFLLGMLLFISSCGSDESNDPAPVDCTTNPIVFTVETTDSNCGLTDGKMEILASGGTGTLTYSSDDGTSFQSTPIFDNLASNTYSVQVRDANDCEKTLSISVGVVGSAVAVSIDNQTNTTCGTSIGEIIVSSTGGVGEVQFRLNNGDPQSSGTFSGLAVGEYTISAVEITTSCESSITATIASGVSFEATIKNIIDTKCAISGCHNGDNGADRNWTVLSNIQNNAANVKGFTQSGAMPQTGSLTQEQIDLIACWVDDGALNN